MEPSPDSSSFAERQERDALFARLSAEFTLCKIMFVGVMANVMLQLVLLYLMPRNWLVFGAFTAAVLIWGAFWYIRTRTASRLRQKLIGVTSDRSEYERALSAQSVFVNPQVVLPLLLLYIQLIPLYILLPKPPAIEDTAFSRRVFFKDGRLEEREETYQIAFWTPAPETDAPTAQPWERGVTDKRLFEFGTKLKDTNAVQGYRRWLVTGHGTTDLKTGYWWIVSVNKGYPAPGILQIYREFWKVPADKAIYVEVQFSAGTYQR